MKFEFLKLSGLVNGLRFVLFNFATPIVFYIAFHQYGAKPAIGLAIGVSFIQLFAHWILKERVSPFFLVASGFTVVFGSIDLVIENPRFFRLEPFAQNLIMAIVLLITYFTEIPLVRWFAHSLPSKIRPEMSESTAKYLKNLTLIWAIYLFLKAFVFLFLALRVDLGDLILLRSVIGGGTLFLLFVGEILYRKLWRERRQGRRHH